MLHDGIIILFAIAYMGLLFGIAYFGDKRAEAGRSIIANPYIYTLSIAIYCTAWTFYGSVGRAAASGLGFLPIYLGPTLIAVLFWFVLRRIVRITKVERITSIADFVASRYGKSTLLGGLVTVIAVVGIMPYISIQLKAIAVSFELLHSYPDMAAPATSETLPIWLDTSFYVAVLLIAFTILFGTRHIDNTERHEGLVAAIAFESIFKLLTFLAVGIFVTYGLFDGLGDIFNRAANNPDLRRLLTFEAIPGGYGGWLSLTFLAMAAFLFLPRQFQVLAIENVDESHIQKASWLFPLYLLIINIFVLPIALGGLLTFTGGDVDADTLVLNLPMAQRQQGLALFVFLGGLSAATGMVIVETVALSTMICNDLVMPVLLRLRSFRLSDRKDLSGMLLAIRRVSIALVVLLGYLFFRFVGDFFPLVTIGLLSFAAAAQFAPAILFGMYWRGANRTGAYMGLLGGFAVWVYTLLLPFSGWLGADFVSHGPFGLALFKPYELLGVSGLNPLSHGVFWSILINIVGVVFGSLLSRPDAVQQVQASRFVDVFEQDRHVGGSVLWRGTADITELRELVTRFLGSDRANRAFSEYTHQHGMTLDNTLQADPALINHVEQLLAGAIGAASARVMVSSVVKGEALRIEEVMTILQESSQAIRHSKELEQKSEQLQAAYTELREVNERLQELDRLKDEFVSTVSHELRTPLTSIRSFSEILLSEPELDIDQRNEFLSIIVKESERLTRLINQVLDMAKMDSGRIDWQMRPIDLRALIRDAISASGQLFREKGAVLHANLGDTPVEITGDSDRLTQVIVNLLSNAVKFCAETDGKVNISLYEHGHNVRIAVQDNGPGVPQNQLKQIFQRFHQATDEHAGKPKGTGLGLTICERIVEHHQGRIWAENQSGHGATFIVELPRHIAITRVAV